MTNSKRINMGAFGGTPQASMSLYDIGNPADVNNDEILDAKDFGILAKTWLNEDLLLAEDVNRNGLVNFPDFAELAENRLWQE